MVVALYAMAEADADKQGDARAQCHFCERIDVIKGLRLYMCL